MRKLNEINYGPLYEMHKVWSPGSKRFLNLSFGVAAFVVVMIVVYVFTRSGLPYGLANGVLIFGVIGGTFLAQYETKQKAKIWHNFGVMNDWKVIPNNEADVSYIPPTMLNLGRMRRTSDIVVAEVEGQYHAMFAYQFRTGSGRSTRNHFYTIVRLELPKKFPHLVLDSKRSFAIHGVDSSLAPVSLEGNFDSYFRLYHTKSEHIDALSIITPDIMQTLINSNAHQDIEIFGRYAYFMFDSEQRTPGYMPMLFSSVIALSDELMHKAKTLRYDNANNAKVAQLKNSQQTIAEYLESDHSLRKSFWFMVYFLILLTIIVGTALVAVWALLQ